MENNWTKSEFLAYLLIYAANSDNVETEEEKEKILALVDEKVVKLMHREFDKDNDYQVIQKLVNYVEHHKVDENEITTDLKLVFAADGDLDQTEQNLLLGLKKVLFK